MEQAGVSPEMHLALTRALPVCHGWEEGSERGADSSPRAGTEAGTGVETGQNDLSKVGLLS